MDNLNYPKSPIWSGFSRVFWRFFSGLFSTQTNQHTFWTTKKHSNQQPTKPTTEDHSNMVCVGRPANPFRFSNSGFRAPTKAFAGLAAAHLGIEVSGGRVASFKVLGLLRVIRFCYFRSILKCMALLFEGVCLSHAFWADANLSGRWGGELDRMTWLRGEPSYFYFLCANCLLFLKILFRWTGIGLLHFTLQLDINDSYRHQ